MLVEEVAVAADLDELNKWAAGGMSLAADGFRGGGATGDG